MSDGEYKRAVLLFDTLVGKPDIEIDKEGHRAFVWSSGPERNSGRVTVESAARPAPLALPTPKGST